MKNKISKITLISTLLVSNVATAKNFYTCVPKKEWVEKVIQEKEDRKEKESWQFVQINTHIIPNKGSTSTSSDVLLETGDIYKFVESETGKSYILNVPLDSDNNKKVGLQLSCNEYMICDLYIDMNFLVRRNLEKKKGKMINIIIYRKSILNVGQTVVK